MKRCGLLLLACVCAYGAPWGPSLEPGSCQDPSTRGAAELALTRINQDRRQGFVFSLNRLSNAHHMMHGPTGVVFYLTLDVLETNCHVLSKRDWKSCEVRQAEDTPVYGQCKATIYIDKVKRVVRLYRYSCMVRPAAASRISRICPDCPSMIDQDDKSVLKTVQMSLEKYNKESGNANYFGLLNVTRASAQGGIADFTFAEFTIQETVCSNSTDVAEAAKCPLMDCEFAHKGHCKASYFQSPEEDDNVEVNCDIFEPEGAEKEKQRHLLGGEHDHSHNHTQEGHDHAHGDTHEHDHTHGHGNTHYHTHEHDHAHHHDDAHNHTHEHDHAHDHTHDHIHKDTHENSHTQDHAQNGTHDHAHDHIHYYGDHHHHHHHHHHGNHTHAHEHDHDHEHKHLHLHVHEHHHHHHDHDQQKTAKEPQGKVRYLPNLDKPVTLPSFPEEPELERPVVMPSFPDQPELERPVVMPSFPDQPELERPVEKEPTILPFPNTLSPKCSAGPKRGASFLDELFDEDPLFKPMAAV